jgi:hypothetical protein
MSKVSWTLSSEWLEAMAEALGYMDLSGCKPLSPEILLSLVGELGESRDAWRSHASHWQECCALWRAHAAREAGVPSAPEGETCPGGPPHWAAGAPSDSCPECRRVAGPDWEA